MGTILLVLLFVLNLVLLVLVAALSCGPAVRVPRKHSGLGGTYTRVKPILRAVSYCTIQRSGPTEMGYPPGKAPRESWRQGGKRPSAIRDSLRFGLPSKRS